MKFLEIKTVTVPSEIIRLGIDPKPEDIIEVPTYINLDQITYLKQNPDDSNSTLIMCNSGAVLTVATRLRDLAEGLGMNYEL